MTPNGSRGDAKQNLFLPDTETNVHNSMTETLLIALLLGIDNFDWPRGGDEFSADEPLEDGTDDEERREVDAGGGRDDHESADRKRGVDVAEDGARVAAGEEVERDREHSADEEEPEDGVVPARSISMESLT